MAKIKKEESTKTVEAVLLNSGGIDSRVTAKMMKDAGYVLHSIYVHANKRKENNRPAAEKTAELYCADHFVFEYPVDWFMIKSRTKRWYGVPFNSLMSHLLGAQYATFLGLDRMVTGMRREGRQGDHVAKLANLIGDALQTMPIAIEAPLYDKKADEVFRIAREQNIPLKDTYSCAIFPPCGKCSSCKKRQRAGMEMT